MLDNNLPKYAKGVEYQRLSDLIGDFRKQIEKDSGAGIQRLECNAALLLRDLCVFLGFRDQLTDKVLGESAADYARAILDQPINLPIKH